MKHKSVLKIASLVLVLAMVFSFASCQKKEDNAPKEGERLTDLLEILVPAVVTNQVATVFENSFVNMNEAFNYMLTQSGVSIPEAYEKLSQQCGTEVTSYIDALKFEDLKTTNTLLNTYGSDYKVTYEIVDDVVLDENQKQEKIRAIKSKLRGSGDGVSIEKFFDESLASEFHQIDLDYTISGFIKSKSATKIITVCLYDGKWVYADTEFF